jgi:glycosyltransferase involved in cell wall biosynthesis
MVNPTPTPDGSREQGAAASARERKRRIVLYEPSGRGGVCHYTHQLAEHLAKAGAEVELITTEDYELANRERHFRLLPLFRASWPTRLIRWLRRPRASTSRRGDSGTGGPSSPARPPSRARLALRRVRLRAIHLRMLIRYLSGRRPDVVHVQWTADRGVDARFLRRLRAIGVPTVYTAHDVEPHMGSGGERDRIARLYDAATRIIVHGESNKKELLSLFRVSPSKVAVIPHGSYDLFSGSGTPGREEARRRLGVPRDARVILFFGLIKRYKGLEHLVEAFRQLRREVPDAFLLVVGEVFAGDPEAHRDYTRLLDELRDREDALCVPRYVPVEAVGEYFAASDVVVLPYTRTFQSGVLLAAYAAGKPVIVSDTGALPETVEAGRSGLVVPPGDAGALARALRELLADPRRLAAMGEHARGLARTVFAWDAVAERTMRLYDTLAGSAAPPRGLPIPALFF